MPFGLVDVKDLWVMHAGESIILCIFQQGLQQVQWGGLCLILQVHHHWAVFRSQASIEAILIHTGQLPRSVVVPMAL